MSESPESLILFARKISTPSLQRGGGTAIKLSFYSSWTCLNLTGLKKHEQHLIEISFPNKSFKMINGSLLIFVTDFARLIIDISIIH
jgi:hypothetical protein